MSLTSLTNGNYFLRADRTAWACEEITARKINDRILDVCDDCGKIVRIDKPVFGSLHLCIRSEEKRARLAREIEARKAYNRAMLRRLHP